MNTSRTFSCCEVRNCFEIMKRNNVIGYIVKIQLYRLKYTSTVFHRLKVFNYNKNQTNENTFKTTNNLVLNPHNK